MPTPAHRERLGTGTLQPIHHKQNITHPNRQNSQPVTHTPGLLPRSIVRLIEDL